MTNFEKWNNAFQSNNLSAFNHNEKALLYLKVRAICRGKLIKQFTDKYQLELKSIKVNNQFSELYSLLENNSNGKNMLNTFLQDKKHTCIQPSICLFPLIVISVRCFFYFFSCIILLFTLSLPTVKRIYILSFV